MDNPRAGDINTAAEQRPVLLAALRSLTLHQREIVVLRIFDDRSENEVAELLGISPGTVKSTLSRAMAQLRQQPGVSGLFQSVSGNGDNTFVREVRYAGN